MTERQRIKSILSELEHAYIGYDNLHGDDEQGCEIIKNVLEMHQRYRWHDLRENPNDIPKNYDIPEDRLIILKTTSKDIPYLPILRDMLKPEIDTDSIIAWKELEPFEEELND